MLKNQLSQNRPNSQNQAAPMPSTRSYILDENGGSSSQAAQMSPNEPEDDDDICPVCESECTCANRSRNIVSLPTPQNYPTGYTVQGVSKNTTGKASPGARPLSLKIKLTLPPRSVSSGTVSSRSFSGRSTLSKQKSRSTAHITNAGEDADGDASRNAQASTSGSLASGSAHDLQSSANPSIPKKRGRPTKAVIAARDAAKHASEARRTSEVTGQSIGNVVVARHTQRSVARGASRINSPSSAKKKGKKLHGAVATSRTRAQQRRTRKKIQDGKTKRQAELENESSDLSELDDDDDHPFGLPTFVPALSSSSNSSSSDSGSDTDSDCDKSIPPYPRPHQSSSLLLADNDYSQRRREYRNTWDVRVRKRSIGVEGTSDEGTDTDSGEDAEEEDEEEDENDEDPDADGVGVQKLVTFSGLARGWTDDEESSFDADLFFANLSDSSDGTSSDEAMAEDAGIGGEEVQDDIPDISNTANLGAVRLSEIAAAGFLTPFADLDRAIAESLPFGQGWDHLSLSNTFRDGLVDLDVELSRRPPLGSLLEPPIPGYEEAEAMMATSEEEEAVAMFENCSQTRDDDDVVEVFEDSDGGETTEDEFVDVDGIAMPRREVLLRFPASLGAIDPMSTVSSPLKGPVGRESVSSPVKLRKSSRSVPKPGDIISGNVALSESPESEFTCGSSKKAAPVPPMGCFKPRLSDKTKHAVIMVPDSSSKKSIPSPYPAVRRLRGRGTSVSMFSRSGSDLSRRSRTPSLLAATRSPFDTFNPGDFDSPDDSQLPPGEPIQIDDVIDAKFLEPDKSDATVPETPTSEACETGEAYESDADRDRHLESLQRWDRIPIDAFRKTRALGGVSDFADKMGSVMTTPRAPRPSDGFSYGSAPGGMMRGSPLGATLWDSNTRTSHNGSPTGDKRGKLSSLLVSPVLLPGRDGDRTPTAERQQQRQQQQAFSSGFAGQHAAYTQQNIKSRKELRKEKKRHRKFFGSTASHLRHNHFPNAKSRATSSMQRIPSLSL